MGNKHQCQRHHQSQLRHHQRHLLYLHQGILTPTQATILGLHRGRITVGNILVTKVMHHLRTIVETVAVMVMAQAQVLEGIHSLETATAVQVQVPSIRISTAATIVMAIPWITVGKTHLSTVGLIKSVEAITAAEEALMATGMVGVDTAVVGAEDAVAFRNIAQHNKECHSTYYHRTRQKAEGKKSTSCHM
jgi:hypothetical protein